MTCRLLAAHTTVKTMSHDTACLIAGDGGGDAGASVLRVRSRLVVVQPRAHAAALRLTMLPARRRRHLYIAHTETTLKQ